MQSGRKRLEAYMAKSSAYREDLTPSGREEGISLMVRRKKSCTQLGLPYVRIFPDMSGIQVSKSASGGIFENP